MCELISAATMASYGFGTTATATAAGTAQAFMVTDALMLAGSAMSAVGQYQQGEYQKGMGEYNARIAENNAITQGRLADDAIARGAAAEDKHREQVRQLIGKQRAAGGGMGIDIDSGSLGNLQTEAAGMGEEDAWTIRTNAAREAWGHKVGAQNFQADAIGSRLKGSLEAKAATMNTMGTMLTAGGQGYEAGVKRKWWGEPRKGV